MPYHAVFDGEGREVPSHLFDSHAIDAAGNVTFRYNGDMPLVVTRIAHPLGFDLPALPYPVVAGARITVPPRPAARVAMVGDVIRNGVVVKD